MSPKSVDFVAEAIESAKALEAEKQELLGRIGANRELCRLLAKSGMVDGEPLQWIQDFYPEKTRGVARTDEENARTLAVRKAAAAEYSVEAAPETDEAAPETDEVAA